MALHVIDPGMLTTVQDLGRFGHGMSGVSACGAADAISLRIGNRLVGNDDGAAAVEMTLRGATFQLDGPAVVALCGSDFAASIARWEPVPVPAGGVIRVGATRGGARCMLCVRGGVDVPSVLGSASTHLPSGIGGVEGRALRKGDRLAAGPDPGRRTGRLAPGARAAIEAILLRRSLRVTPGPQSDWFTGDALAAFTRESWSVTEAADRMGLRLAGPALGRSRPGDLVTEGVSLGAVQVPDGGRPIILFVDQQTTGGYPKIASVITADLAAVGHLRPRDRIRFELVDLGGARAILARQEADLAAAFEGA